MKWANNFRNPSITPITLEIKLCNKETSIKIKRIFRDLKRDDIRVEDNMYIANNYTQATRVRVEIMKSIVKNVPPTKTERFYTSSATDRL